MKTLYTLLATSVILSTDLVAQTFSNTTAAACNTWDSGNAYTGFQRTIAVAALPTPLGASGTVLRQVNLQLGTAACKGNLSTYYARIVSPTGTVIQLFGPFTTTSTSQWMNIKFRDDIALERVRDYSTTTQQGYHPWNVGYCRTDAVNAFTTVNGEDPNGNWTFQLAENTTSEVSFQRVELVFGPPIVVTDVTGGSGNDFCSGATCIDGLSVIRGTNLAYPPLDPFYPGDVVGGCGWNGANNNNGWYRFVASGTTANITVSGMVNTTGTGTADMQLVVVQQTNPICSGPPTLVPTGGCPDPPGVNNTSYAAPNGGVGTMANVYLNGITANCEFNLSGLTAGNSYYLIIDGNGGLSSTFYIEMPSGGIDCNILLPVTWTAFNVECEMGKRRISWTVATQQDNDHFEVERSLDGSSWNVFATVPGEGNTQTTMSYEVLDDNSDILFEQPLIYYRVKQVDVNGNFSFTPVEASSCSVLLYPNPASDHIIVAVPFAGVDVQLVDAIGRVVEMRKTQGTTIRMDIGHLASGYYALQLLSSGDLLGSAVVVKF